MQRKAKKAKRPPVAQAAEDAAPAAVTISDASPAKPEPTPQPKPEFQRLRCIDTPPDGFTPWGRFARNDYPTVIGRSLMRR